MIDIHHNGERVGSVLALHLNGDSSLAGHRYHLCEEVRVASKLDIYADSAAKDIPCGSELTLVEDEQTLRLFAQAVFDLRDHALIKATARE